MKLAGALLVMGILVVLTGVNDGSTTTLEDAGEESSTAAGDTGRELLLLFGYHHVLYSYYYYLQLLLHLSPSAELLKFSFDKATFVLFQASLYFSVRM